MKPITDGMVANMNCSAAGEQVVQRVGALVGNVLRLGADALAEHEARQVRRRADAGRAVVQLARVGLGVGDELVERLRRQRRDGTTSTLGTSAICTIGTRSASGSYGRLLNSVWLTAIGPDRVDDQGVAVGRRAHRELGAEVAAGAGLVVDHERLLEALGELLRRRLRARMSVVPPAVKATTTSHRLGGIGRRLRPDAPAASAAEARMATSRGLRCMACLLQRAFAQSRKPGSMRSSLRSSAGHSIRP